MCVCVCVCVSGELSLQVLYGNLMFVAYVYATHVRGINTTQNTIIMLRK